MARHAWMIPIKPRKQQHLQVVHRMAFESLGATSMEIAQHRAAKLLPAEVEALYQPLREAFAAFRVGRGNHFYCRALCDAVNVGAELAASHQIASDHKATFAAAEAALAAVMRRHAAGGSWVLKGTEIAALDLAAQVHRAQLLHCSHGELGQAVTTVTARIKAALRGDHAPGVTVLDPGQPTTCTANA